MKPPPRSDVVCSGKPNVAIRDVKRAPTVSSKIGVASGQRVVSEPKPLRPLRDLQYGLGETVSGGCRHLEYMNIWGFNEPK